MMSQVDQARVEAAITAAEAHTTGEIFCIVATRKEGHPDTVLAAAAFAAFALPLAAVLLGYRPWAIGDDWLSGPVSPYRVVAAFIACQLAVFAATAALVSLTSLNRTLTPARHRHAHLHQLAQDQFLARGLHETSARTGVLLLASPAERYAEVIADEGIYAKVSPNHWNTTLAALTQAARAGDLAGGFERAIALAGGVLAEHFPAAAHGPNQLPNRIVEI